MAEPAPAPAGPAASLALASPPRRLWGTLLGLIAALLLGAVLLSAPQRPAPAHHARPGAFSAPRPRVADVAHRLPRPRRSAVPPHRLQWSPAVFAATSGPPPPASALPALSGPAAALRAAGPSGVVLAAAAAALLAASGAYLCVRRLARPAPGRRRRVVIAGGGFAGLSAARLLSADPALRVMLVEPKDYFEYTPGILRAFVEPAAAKRLLVPLEEAIPKGCEWIRGRVTAVNPEDPEAPAVTVQPWGVDAAPQTVPYDTLLVCTGSQYAAPVRPSLGAEASQDDRLAALEAVAGTVAQAKSVVVVGGGIVGVELAAEIAAAHPSVRVTLVSRSPALLSDLPAPAGQAAASWLCRHGVDVVVGDVVARRTALAEGRTRCELASGREVDADLVFDCVGSPPTSDFFPPTVAGVGRLDRRGRIQVDSRLEACPGVVACGDVIRRTDTATPDVQTAVNADLGARIAAHRLTHPAAAATALPPRLPRVMCVSLGPRSGILVLEDAVLHGRFWGFVAALTKTFIETFKLLEARQVLIARVLWTLVDSLLLMWGGVLGRSSLAPSAAAAACT